MNNWFVDYHHALRFRLLCLVIVFGVVLPGIRVLAWPASRSRRYLARPIAIRGRASVGHLP